MKYLKFLIVLGALVLSLCFGDIILAYGQGSLLTEISVDIKYIKENIIDIRKENRDLRIQVQELDRRVIGVEQKIVTLDKLMNSITERNNWLMWIVGGFVVSMLGLQYKQNINRSKNGKNTDKSN